MVRDRFKFTFPDVQLNQYSSIWLIHHSTLQRHAQIFQEKEEKCEAEIIIVNSSCYLLITLYFYLDRSALKVSMFLSSIMLKLKH